MTRTGDREIGVVSGRLPDNPGTLACMNLGRTLTVQSNGMLCTCYSSLENLIMTNHPDSSLQ